MHSRALAILVTIGFSGVGVVGDYFLKLASQRDDSLRSGAFYIGFAVYAATAFGWVFAMKHLQLATIGALYSVSIVLLLTILGTVRFGESLSALEVVGLLMAVGSLILLGRFG
jgi:multidrug transporter EmrE-like cation transporter